MADPIVIVGASLAGVRAASAMRSGGHEGEIVVVGEEDRLPYTRPPLSKGVLKGVEEPESTDIGGGKLEVTWRLGTPASGLDRDRRHVVLADGERIPYSRVIVATGSRPRPWPGAGAELAGLHTLRTLDDAIALRDELRREPRLVTIGAGFIGCEVAATARTLGLEVTMVDIAERPLTAFGPGVGEWVERLHRSHGVELRLGVGVDAVEGADRVEGVRLADGTRVDADLAVVALGAVPVTEWLQDSGLAIGTGVLCDATLTSVSDPDVLVAGDAVAWPHPLARQNVIRVEHWTNAAEGGRIAGRNALREPSERDRYETVPTMWSDQFGIRIQVAGLPEPTDPTRVLEAHPDEDRLVAACPDSGRIRAAVAIEAPRRMVWYRRQSEQGASVDEIAAAVLADEGALGPPREAVPS